MGSRDCSFFFSSFSHALAQVIWPGRTERTETQTRGDDVASPLIPTFVLPKTLSSPPSLSFMRLWPVSFRNIQTLSNRFLPVETRFVIFGCLLASAYLFTYLSYILRVNRQIWPAHCNQSHAQCTSLSVSSFSPPLSIYFAVVLKLLHWWGRCRAAACVVNASPRSIQGRSNVLHYR